MYVYHNHVKYQGKVDTIVYFKAVVTVGEF